MRRNVRRVAALLLVATLSVIVLFHLVYKPSLVLRYQREGARHRTDQLDSLVHALQNCSCFMNYMRNQTSRDGGGNASEPSVSGLRTTVSIVGSGNLTENNTKEANATELITPAAEESADELSSSVPPKRAAKYMSEPIDDHMYSYTHNPESLCFHENGTKREIYLLFFVPTAPANLARREVIRHTFGNENSWPTKDGARPKTLFMLGATKDPTIQSLVDDEAFKYGDVVQESFIDSYLNLTRKTIMGLKWVTNYCRHAQYVMKIDDDTTVNQPRILEIIRNAPREKFNIGHVFKKPVVNRDRKSKFYMSQEYFPNSTFPAYINGVAYIMSSDLVEATYHIATMLPLFPWEDVFIGMCLHRLGIDLKHDDKFMYWGSFKHIAGASGVRIGKGHAIFTNIPKDFLGRIYNKFIQK